MVEVEIDGIGVVELDELLLLNYLRRINKRQLMKLVQKLELGNHLI